MKRTDMETMVRLTTKKFSGKDLTRAEKTEYNRLLNLEKADNSQGLKADKEKFAKVEAKAHKESVNILRVAIQRIAEIYNDAGLTDTPKAKSIKFSYNKRVNVKPSAKNIELKLVSHNMTKANAKAKADRKKARELKKKIETENARAEQAKNERNENGVLYSELRNENGVLYSA